MNNDDRIVWEVFHGKNLDKIVSKAHSIPNGYEIAHIKVQYINHEYVLTIIAVANDDSLIDMLKSLGD